MLWPYCEEWPWVWEILSILALLGRSTAKNFCIYLIELCVDEANTRDASVQLGAQIIEPVEGQLVVDLILIRLLAPVVPCAHDSDEAGHKHQRQPSVLRHFVQRGGEIDELHWPETYHEAERQPQSGLPHHDHDERQEHGCHRHHCHHRDSWDTTMATVLVKTWQ